MASDVFPVGPSAIPVFSVSQVLAVVSHSLFGTGASLQSVCAALDAILKINVQAIQARPECGIPHAGKKGAFSRLYGCGQEAAPFLHSDSLTKQARSPFFPSQPPGCWSTQDGLSVAQTTISGSVPGDWSLSSSNAGGNPLKQMDPSQEGQEAVKCDERSNTDGPTYGLEASWFGEELPKRPLQRAPSRVPCKLFTTGACSFGDRCWFSHAFPATSEDIPSDHNSSSGLTGNKEEMTTAREVRSASCADTSKDSTKKQLGDILLDDQHTDSVSDRRDPPAASATMETVLDRKSAGPKPFSFLGQDPSVFSKISVQKSGRNLFSPFFTGSGAAQAQTGIDGNDGALKESRVRDVAKRCQEIGKAITPDQDVGGKIGQENTADLYVGEKSGDGTVDQGVSLVPSVYNGIDGNDGSLKVSCTGDGAKRCQVMGQAITAGPTLVQKIVQEDTADQDVGEKFGDGSVDQGVSFVPSVHKGIDSNAVPLQVSCVRDVAKRNQVIEQAITAGQEVGERTGQGNTADQGVGEKSGDGTVEQGAPLVPSGTTDGSLKVSCIRDVSKRCQVKGQAFTADLDVGEKTGQEDLADPDGENEDDGTVDQGVQFVPSVDMGTYRSNSVMNPMSDVSSLMAKTGKDSTNGGVELRQKKINKPPFKSTPKPALGQLSSFDMADSDSNGCVASVPSDDEFDSFYREAISSDEDREREYYAKRMKADSDSESWASDSSM